MGNFSKLIQSLGSKKQEGGQSKSSSPTVQLKDNRAENAIQLKLSELFNSKKGKMPVQFSSLPDDELQLKGLEEEELQMKGIEEEEELQMKAVGEEEELQMKSMDSALITTSVQSSESNPAQKAENNTGLPNQLKSGVENLSGFSLDDVKVHYNSDQPARLNAHAYAQGTNIHVAPGQEKHLPHEAWHVVQQKQGRVKPTRQLKGKINLNDDAGLEKEADVMGSRVVQTMPKHKSFNSIAEKSGVPAIQSKQLPIQRNEESTEVLKDIAKPKVGQQDIELSSEIHEKIEKIYRDKIEKSKDLNEMDLMKYNSAVCLGGIILPSLRQYDNLGSLVKDSKFVNLGKGAVALGIYKLLPADLKKLLVLNTLQTMYYANQLDYLWYSEFGGVKDSGWKVVVEVHYYRERPTSLNVFHKDTLGKTLFVNLNYLNKKKIIGPEYVVNPQDSPEHLQKIAESLPKEFLKDRESVMNELDKPQIIEVVEVPEYGYVAFVDEIIHHSSPTTQHRKVKGQQVRDYLKGKKNELYTHYWEAYEKWSTRSPEDQKTKYKKYVKDEHQKDASLWKTFFDHNDADKSYDRNQIRMMDPKGKLIKDSAINTILHEANYTSFGEASIPNPGGKSIKSPMTKKNKPLKRRMSVNLDSGSMKAEDKVVDGRRSFLRTWVRAEKKETEVTNKKWGWKQK